MSLLAEGDNNFCKINVVSVWKSSPFYFLNDLNLQFKIESCLYILRLNKMVAIQISIVYFRS